MILTGYITENKDGFFTKVYEITAKLGIDPNWLMAVMFKESGLNHRAVNHTTGATGLIQFMPATAASLGTTTEALKNMTNVNQLDYVYKYLHPYRFKMKSYTDVYLAVFFPAAIGKPDNYVLETSTLPASLIAEQNQSMDWNHDHKITKAEVERWALAGFPPDTVNLLKKKA